MRISVEVMRRTGRGWGIGTGGHISGGYAGRSRFFFLGPVLAILTWERPVPATPPEGTTGA